MILFCNKHLDVDTTDYAIIDKFFNNPSELKMLGGFDKIIIKNFIGNVFITNKGGKRLINYINYLVENFSDKEIIIVYDSAKINFILKTSPFKLTGSSYYEDSVFSLLSSSSIKTLKYLNGVGTPVKFSSNQDAMNWFLHHESRASIQVISELTTFLKENPALLSKDLPQFKENFNSVKELSTNYSMKEEAVIECFSSLLS